MRKFNSTPYATEYTETTEKNMIENLLPKPANFYANPVMCGGNFSVSSVLSVAKRFYAN